MTTNPPTAEEIARVYSWVNQRTQQAHSRELTCAMCGSTFTASNTRARFCGATCRSNNRHRIKREAKQGA